MTNTMKMTTLFLLILAGVLFPSVKVVAQTPQKAIVDLATHPMDAMSRFPVGGIGEHSYYVVRVLQRNAPTGATSPYNTSKYADVNKKDEFTALGYLYMTSEGNLAFTSKVSLDSHLDEATNFQYAWQIYTETGSDHKQLQFYSPNANKYLTHSSNTLSYSNAKPSSSWFQVNTYADHMLVQKIDNDGKPVFEEVTEHDHTYKKPVMVQEDDYIYSKHFLYLGTSDYKIRYNGSSLEVVQNNTENTRDYSDTYLPNESAEQKYVLKDDIVFEIYAAEVATSGQTTYEFHATDPTSGAKWQFELEANSDLTFAADNTVKGYSDFQETINGVSMSKLRYYTTFSKEGTNYGTSAFPKYKVTCVANFPFPISNDENFDYALNEIDFLTLSIGAPHDNMDGYYIGREKQSASDADLAKHGHQAEDKGKYMTDFHRHIFSPMFFHITKSETGVENPNSVRLHQFETKEMALHANIHESGDQHPIISYTQKKDEIAHASCDHDIFLVVPNHAEGDATDKGFSLVLKSDPTKKWCTTYVPSATEPDRTTLYVGAATGTTDAAKAQQTRMYASSADDIINLAINHRDTKNVGGMKPESDDWYAWYISAYYDAKNWKKTNPGINVASILSQSRYDDEWVNAMMYSVRLQYLEVALQSVPDYYNIDPNKQYRIELYGENLTGNNSVLSSINCYLNDGGTAIPAGGADMSNADTQTSILKNYSAASAPSYWMMKTLNDNTPESGEELIVTFYNSNMDAYLKKTETGVTLEKVANPSTIGDDFKFYIKQEGTSDQWVILNTLSTNNTVKKLCVDGGLKWEEGYQHVGEISKFSYTAQNKGRWMFTEIASYPLTISNVGWASLCLPYAVKFEKSSGVNVYYASGTREATNEDKKNQTEGQPDYNYSAMMQLSDVTSTDGTYMYIPANTPVLFSKPGDATVNLEIVDNNVDVSSYTNISGNKFTAVNAQWGHYSLASGNGGIDDNAYFGLGSKASHGVAFYPIVKRPTETAPYLVANKAFLTEANTNLPVSQLKALTFVFEDDDTVTEINTVAGTATTRPADGIYYDLSGRRVTNPKKGIYVNSNGKKFNVK